jgi:type III secretory pathway component EscT
MKWLRRKAKKLTEKPLSGGLAMSGALDIVAHGATGVEKLEEEMPKLFRWLVYVEFALVVLIGTCVAALAVYTAVWIVWGGDARGEHPARAPLGALKVS